MHLIRDYDKSMFRINKSFCLILNAFADRLPELFVLMSNQSILLTWRITRHYFGTNKANHTTACIYTNKGMNSPVFLFFFFLNFIENRYYKCTLSNSASNCLGKIFGYSWLLISSFCYTSFGTGSLMRSHYCSIHLLLNGVSVLTEVFCCIGK